MSDLAGTPVIVLTWNGWKDAFQCLQSVRSHGGGCPVWLVDNASREDRRAEAVTLEAGHRWTVSGRPGP